MVDRNKKSYRFAVRLHLRNALVLLGMSLVFLIFGLWQERGFLSDFLLAFAGVMGIGAVFAFLNVRKAANLSKI